MEELPQGWLPGLTARVDLTPSGACNVQLVTHVSGDAQEERVNAMPELVTRRLRVMAEEEGDAQAMAALGTCYESGECAGVARDLHQMAYWYE